jgi:hypothetical protein
MAFTAPELVKAIAKNRLPRGIGLTEMADLPNEWSAQREALGIADRDAKPRSSARFFGLQASRPFNAPSGSARDTAL